MPRVVSFGSVNVDHVGYLAADRIDEFADRYDWFPDAGETVRVESVPDDVRAALSETFLGGKGANQAVAAAAADAEATLLGRVGEDDDELAVRETLAERGVDVSVVDVVDEPTGYAAIVVNEAGENRIAIVAGANGRVDADYAARHGDRIAEADCLLLQNELPAEAMLAALDELDGRPDRPTVVFDPAPADEAERVLGHPCVDVVKPNEQEASALSAALSEFDGTIVRTLGERGASVIDRSGRATDGDDGGDGNESGDGTAEECTFAVDAPAVEPVDTTGAGDVFDGYLAAELARGSDLRRAVRVAAVAGALSTTAEGVQTAMPSLAEVLERLENGDG